MKKQDQGQRKNIEALSLINHNHNLEVIWSSNILRTVSRAYFHLVNLMVWRDSSAEIKPI